MTATVLKVDTIIPSSHIAYDVKVGSGPDSTMTVFKDLLLSSEQNISSVSDITFSNDLLLVDDAPTKVLDVSESGS